MFMLNEQEIDCFIWNVKLLSSLSWQNDYIGTQEKEGKERRQQARKERIKIF